jgi:polyphosphate kinase
MTRNLDRRIEIVFPVHDAKVKKRLRDILKTYLGDTVKARMLEPDGSYRRVEPGATPVRSQQTFLPSKRRS